jgi:hypothetical protein
MAEEIHVKGTVGAGSDRRQFPGHRLEAEHGTRQGAQAAGVRHRDRKHRALHARHRRLDHRQFRAQQFAQVHVRPDSLEWHGHYEY